MVNVIPPTCVPERVNVSVLSNKLVASRMVLVALVKVSNPVPVWIKVIPKLPSSSSSEAVEAALPLNYKDEFRLVIVYGVAPLKFKTVAPTAIKSAATVTAVVAVPEATVSAPVFAVYATAAGFG